MKLTGSMRVNVSEEGSKFFVGTSGLGASLIIAGFDGNAKLRVEDNLLKRANKNDVYDIEITIRKR